MSWPKGRHTRDEPGNLFDEIPYAYEDMYSCQKCGTYEPLHNYEMMDLCEECIDKEYKKKGLWRNSLDDAYIAREEKKHGNTGVSG